MQAPGHSGVYFGAVRHRRFDATGHGFRTRLYMAYLDLDELDAAFHGRWFWSMRRWAPMRFRRADYFGPPTQPLAEAVQNEVAPYLGHRPDGPVRVLTNLRCFGYLQNPVSIYYCFDREERLVAALAEITNTPWGERHHYVITGNGTGTSLRATFGKQFHVSPFQPMDLVYDWTLARPGQHLAVHMQSHRAGGKVFDATLLLRRAPWTTRSLGRALLCHPWITGKVVLGIYWHAARLWWKRAPFHVHPRKQAAS